MAVKNDIRNDETATEKKRYRSRYADDLQANVYKHFPSDHFLGNEQNVDHFMHWVTFYRRNLHRFATDVLGIKLHLYQIIMLYLMGVSQFFVVIASRASAKSFIIALYACIKCMLYPNYSIVLASGTRGQSKLLVSEKIQKELMSMSPVLRRAISKIKDNQGEVTVYFKDHASITVVTANDNARGHRSNCIVREEFRQIKKNVDDGILSPFQITRQTPYMKLKAYENIPELLEQPCDVYISSSWISDGHWMWDIVDKAYSEMLAGKPSCLLAFDESIALKHKIKTLKYFQSEKKKQDPTTWRIEFLNERVQDNQHAFFTYSMFQENQKLRRPFYPRAERDVLIGKKNPYEIPRQKGEIRALGCDFAFVDRKGNDRSAFTFMRLIPETKRYEREAGAIDVSCGYRRYVQYIETRPGGDMVLQARRIRQLFEDMDCDYLVLDLRNGGVACYDILARVQFDPDRNTEYSPLMAMNDNEIASRIKSEGAKPCVYVINATQKLNSDIAVDFHRVLEQHMIEFLIPYETAQEEVLSLNKDYVSAPDAETQLFYEGPFLETQALINECTELTYEKKEQTGAIVVKEPSTGHKDRYSSCSYLSYFATLLERDLFANNDDFEFGVFIN